jgi:phytanoyl-CoA hydroxylase
MGMTISSSPAAAAEAQPVGGISAADWTGFEHAGYLRLGRTLAADELAALQERIDAFMLGQLSDPRLMMQLDLGGEYGAMAPMTLGHKGASLAYRKIENLEHDDRFGAFVRQPRFRAICDRVYGHGTAVGVYRAMFMNKPAGQGTLLPWHQDGGAIWGLDRDPLMTVWTALDDATRANGCVQVVPGSHRLGLLSSFGHTITPEQAEELCRPEQVVHLELRAGESVLLHNWTLHRSDVNRTTAPRRAFSVCYLDARTEQRDRGACFPAVF